MFDDKSPHDRHQLIDKSLVFVIRSSFDRRSANADTLSLFHSAPKKKEMRGSVCSSATFTQGYRRRGNLTVTAQPYAPFSPAIINEGYSLCKRYKESGEQRQECRCGKDWGETAVVAILLLLSSPSVRAVSLHN